MNTQKVLPLIDKGITLKQRKGVRNSFTQLGKLMTEIPYGRSADKGEGWVVTFSAHDFPPEDWNECVIWHPTSQVIS